LTALSSPGLSLCQPAIGVSYGPVSGDYPRWLISGNGPRALIVNRTELWQVLENEPPQLLLRQSEPLVQARWHRSGTNIFYATGRDLYALELDERSGRIVNHLATFDQINDFDLLGKNIYVAGTLNGVPGLWKLALE
jgi:hypothetical protein